MSGLEKRFERGQHLPENVFVEGVEEPEQVAQFVGSAKSDDGGSFYLHLHGRFSECDTCAILEHRAGLPLCPRMAVIKRHNGLAQAGHDTDEISVLVGILESTEDREGVVLGRFRVLPCATVRLQLLEACNDIAWQVLGCGQPLPSCISVDIRPGHRIDQERVFEMEGEACFSLALWGGDGNDEMVERRPNFEKEISENDGERLGGGIVEMWSRVKRYVQIRL